MSYEAFDTIMKNCNMDTMTRNMIISRASGVAHAWMSESPRVFREILQRARNTYDPMVA